MHLRDTHKHAYLLHGKEVDKQKPHYLCAYCLPSKQGSKWKWEACEVEVEPATETIIAWPAITFHHSAIICCIFSGKAFCSFLWWEWGMPRGLLSCVLAFLAARNNRVVAVRASGPYALCMHLCRSQQRVVDGFGHLSPSTSDNGWFTMAQRMLSWLEGALRRAGGRR